MSGQEIKIDIEALRRGGVVQLKDDYFSVWVKILCNNASGRQLRHLADITEKYAKGFLLFTTRQIPIIPFIKLEDVQTVKQDLEAYDLRLDACGPRIRGIDVCYDAKLCPFAQTDALSLGQKLDQFFYREEVRFKVKLSVSGCVKGCTVPNVLSDIGFVGKRVGDQELYDVYLGGRLGMSPAVGQLAASDLTENQSVTLASNLLEYIQSEGKSGERLADIVRRKGLDEIAHAITQNLNPTSPIPQAECKTKLTSAAQGKAVLRIKALCGEVWADSLRVIADVAEKYGLGFVHFDVWGAPEVPGVENEAVISANQVLAAAGLQVLGSRGIDNIQSCFGSYCIRSSADVQKALKKASEHAESIGLDQPGLRISGSGCANSCAISHLADIGLLGWSKPAVDESLCTGCGLCAAVCNKKKSISIQNQKAVIDYATCGYCGECLRSCPYGGIRLEKRGITILAGGRSAVRPDSEKTAKTSPEVTDFRLGVPVAEFLNDDQAEKATAALLDWVKETGRPVWSLLDLWGVNTIKERLASVVASAGSSCLDKK